jgi:4-hydroxybenzoate polyprenyltransferase
MVKIFAREPWDKVRFVPKKLRGFLDLFRFFTLFPPAIGGICGAMMAIGVYDNFDFITLIYGVGTIIFVNAASNVLNQVYDAEIDTINKPYRPIPSGIVTKDEARIISYFLYLITLFRACMINVDFASLILIIMLLTVIYSVEPIRLKKRLLLSNISIALGRGLLGFVAAWCIFGRITDKIPWLVGCIMFIYLLGATTTKDFSDVKGDRYYNIKTLPVVYGRNKAIVFSAPFFIFPFALIPLGIGIGLLPQKTIYLSMLAVWGAYIVFLLWKYGETLDKKFENTPAWKHMYFMLMTTQVGFCLSYLL